MKIRGNYTYLERFHFSQHNHPEADTRLKLHILVLLVVSGHKIPTFKCYCVNLEPFHEKVEQLKWLVRKTVFVLYRVFCLRLHLRLGTRWTNIVPFPMLWLYWFTDYGWSSGNAKVKRSFNVVSNNNHFRWLGSLPGSKSFTHLTFACLLTSSLWWTIIFLLRIYSFIPHVNSHCVVVSCICSMYTSLEWK